MNSAEFTIHFLENLVVGLILTSAGAALSLLVMRRYIYSLFDPLFFLSVLSGMAGGVVLYLWWFDLTRQFYVWTYLATQTAFYVGVRLVEPAPMSMVARPEARRPRDGETVILYPMVVVVFVTAQLAVYAVSGVPLFLESRLSAFAEGSGYGLLSRVTMVTSTAAVTLATYRLFVLRSKGVARFVDVMVLTFAATVGVLSGSKAALLLLAFTMSLTLFYGRRLCQTDEAERLLKRVLFLLVALAIPAALVTVSIQADLDGVTALLAAVGLRFVQTGDIFYLVYPSDVLTQLADGNGVLALFYSPLGALRLVAREELPVNLGLQAFWYHYGMDVLSGPNARHNVFGVHYFGAIGAVPFSLILGWLYALVRGPLYFALPARPMGLVAFVLVSTSAMYIEQDVSGQAIEYLFSTAAVFGPLWLLATLIACGARRPAPGASLGCGLGEAPHFA